MRPSRRLAVTVALALNTLAVVGGSSALAGSYVATNCSLVVQGARDAVSSSNTTVFPRSVDCERNASDTGLRIHNTGGVGGGYGYGAWSWYAPPGTVFSDLFFKFNLASEAGHAASITVPGAGIWTTPPFSSGWNSVDTVPLLASSLTAWLECPGSCAPSSSAHAYIKDLYLTVTDSTAPSISDISGALLAPGVRRGSQELSVSANDGAALSAVTLRANGVLIDERSTTCDYAFNGGPVTSLYPCPTSAQWTLPVNTELLPDGENTIEVCVFDFSFDPGSRNSTCETRDIAVDNSCPSSGGVPATGLAAGLQAGAAPARDALRLPSNRSANVRGTLHGPGNVAGSTVCLYEQVDLPGDGRELVDTARVRNDGTFALDVAAGPSRNFDVVYRYNAQTVERERLHLDAFVAPDFRIVGRRRLVNGQRVRFRGRIPGPNAEGRGISLQARAGRKWRTFKQVRAEADGQFRGLYRFTQTLGTAEYVFRARVKRQGNYPYSPGSSKLRSVVVRGPTP